MVRSRPERRERRRGPRFPVVEGDLEAGVFSDWLDEVRGALREEQASDVPCDGCTACCTSSQFVHIGPDEADTLAHIPSALLFPAPRMTKGHVVLGYDERGHCPMLVDGACSIYEHRPSTCRTYDCRVLAAAGVGADESQPDIGRRVVRWRFSHPAHEDRAQHEAVRAAASYLAANAAHLPSGAVPAHPTQLAVLAVEVSSLFLGGKAPLIDDVAAALPP